MRASNFLHSTSNLTEAIKENFLDPFEQLIHAILPSKDAATTAKEYTDHIKLIIEIPGYTKDQIKISIEKSILKVAGSKTAAGEEDSSFVRTLFAEKTVTTFERTFRVGMEIDKANINAKVENGILTIYLQKFASDPAININVH